MTEKYIAETIKSEQMTLSQVIWRLLRRQPVGYLERVLAFNQHLSLQFPYLSVGSVVKLPVEDITDEKRNADVIRLWD
ncbi:MAG: phage tail protein [Mesorhizobium sp.]|uniref:phage tail protein n=1 Tax=Mesorhizobium sp. TaxID=1871066 RepID=UPI00120EA90E|nr:phage tail protein [Mesorhizobium sp.]TIR24039.1 MAG: phage tail protein [Mesorhizobium sp.]